VVQASTAGRVALPHAPRTTTAAAAPSSVATVDPSVPQLRVEMSSLRRELAETRAAAERAAAQVTRRTSLRLSSSHHLLSSPPAPFAEWNDQRGAVQRRKSCESCNFRVWHGATENGP
jgi:hypothetical protein